ncbi:MAG: DUF2189 domain-containing protein [Alphaproteobacteria bacterium]|nr:DUF2189 domain-containing protein [Alphaproteobacteria bacterium]
MAEVHANESEETAKVASLVVRMPTMDDPWRWLAKGWRDLWSAPVLSLGYGAVFVLAGLLGTAGLWLVGWEPMVPIAAAGFALLGPILAVGLYEISRRLELGLPIRLRDVVFVRTAAPVQLGFMAFLLIFIYLVWLRAATLLIAFFIYDNVMPLGDFLTFVLTTPEGLALLVVGTIIGGLLALITFVISALAIPILMQKDIDAMTAMSASVEVMMDAPGPMLLWGWLIGVLTVFGFATMFIGLIVIFPLIGHATWHAYRSIIEDPQT